MGHQARAFLQGSDATTAQSASVRPTTGETAVRTEDGSMAPQNDFLDLDTLSEVIMAVNLTDRGAIGCAYYVARTETLHFMEDMQMGDPDMVDACSSSISQCFLVSSLTSRSEALH